MKDRTAGRRVVFIVITPDGKFYHDLEGPRSDDKCVLRFQSANINYYTINRSSFTMAHFGDRVNSAAMLLCEALGDPISSLADLKPAPRKKKLSEQEQAAKDATERMF